jgi:hypothetical protein
VNFTREPIIETVITPREGCKLVVRSSKGNGQEDYYVDAVEVVSFGRSFFFRSVEKPKSFLVPTSDYEILELRETRMVLKNVSAERAIKIGGGRDAPPRPREPAPREVSPEEDREPQESSSSEEPSVASADNKGVDRKRDRRRRGRRGGQNRVGPAPQTGAENTPVTPIEGVEQMEGSSSAEEPKAPSFISKLFPPPPTLIKETLGRYKVNEPLEQESFNQSSDDSPKHSVEEGSIDLSDPNEEGLPRDEREFEE